MPRKPKSSSESTALAEAPSPGAAPARDAHASKPTGRRIFLIDAMSFIFRAYHAMARQRPMSTRTGVPTAATYVFTNMLNKLRDDFHPEYLAAVFDVAGPTFRDTQGAAVSEIRKWDIRTQQFQNVAYGGYKANRAEMPPDLAQQVPYIRRALAAFRIPILENPGYEADDVIGTLARQGAEQGREVFVVSSDKDMLQLVNEHVCVLNPPKDNLICDRAKVEEILGVPPERVIDVMALRGDTIDNIPGAPGIGDKGSVELIRRFGSVEAALEHASEVEKKTYRESLLNNREQILYSKDQVTIDCHVPGVTLDAALLETMAAQEPDIEACRELFTELEFTTLLKTIAPVTDVQEKNYLENAGREEVRELLAHASRQARLALAIDMAVAVPSPSRGAEGEDDHDEHAGGSESNLFSEANAPAAPAAQMIALSTKAGQALTASIDSPEIRQALESPSLPKAVHDSKAAMRSLSPVEFASTGAAPAPRLRGVVHDTALYSYLLDPTYSSHSLADVALRRFNLQLSGGLAEAADMTGRLAKALSEEVDREDLRTVYEEIDLPLVPVLERMEAAGVKIDCDVLKQMSARLERECDAKAREIYQRSAVEFNINSPKQLGEVLFEKLGLRKPVKYGKGKTVSTAAEVLQDLAEEHQVPRLVLQYRELSKLKSTYVDALPTLLNHCTQRLHTTFNQVGTATGRLSSNNPNLQNIPIKTELGREIRAAFIAEPGNVLLSADYSQIELRLLAHFSGEPLMLEAFARGEDFHLTTAAEVFGLMPDLVTPEIRNRAKAINFGIPYGLSGFGLAQQLGIDKKEAQQYIDAYFARYQQVRRWIEATKEQARRDQKVQTLLGRVRPIPDINSKNFNMRGFAERTAVNTPLQGTAADLIKLAMIRIDAELQRRELRSRMTLQVHDELVFEVPQAEIDEMCELVRELMEGVHPELRAPLEVDIGVGPNWRDLE